MLVFSSFSASLRVISPIPFSGITASPSPNILNTNRNIREEVLRSGSRKIPLKNGRKKFLIIFSEKPFCSRNSRVVVSGSLKISSGLNFFSSRFSFKILNLSEILPIPEKILEARKEESLKGSPMLIFLPFRNITAPGFSVFSFRSFRSRYCFTLGYSFNKTWNP